MRWARLVAELAATARERDRLHDALTRIEPLLEHARPMPALVIVRQTLHPIPEQRGPTWPGD